MTDAPLPVRRVPGSRRVMTPPVPGSDPEPQAGSRAIRAGEDTDGGWGQRPEQGGNDAQLRADVPPHWGTHSH
ncbi:hypothetical protein [Mycetocola spongiae]|uniref:hypothetical protein n=1 Tax=Mycetocola spongiae TaxID=2859226 RepID=UPI001CF119A9|nr:hypothetical protein [Mycetocola spongiae]UCR88852.1 hypothetical protein KXZ72_13015 [Mycetocola spongiae]